MWRCSQTVTTLALDPAAHSHTFAALICEATCWERACHSRCRLTSFSSVALSDEIFCSRHQKHRSGHTSSS